MGLIVAAILSVTALSGCAAVSGGGSTPRDPETQTVPSEKFSSLSPQEFDDTNCVDVPEGALSALNDILIDSADSIDWATAWFDTEAKLWIVNGSITRSEGEDALGHWATSDDVAADPFAGRLWALDGGAQQFTTAPLSSAHNLDAEPRTIPFLKCDQVL